MLGRQRARKFGLNIPTETLMTSVKTEVATTPHKKINSNLKITVFIYDSIQSEHRCSDVERFEH